MIKRHHKFAFLAVIFICLIFVVFLFFISLSTRLDNLSNYVIEDINISLIDDGIYRGESETSPVYIDLEVTIENHEITNLEIYYTNVFINEEDLLVVIDLIYQNQSIDFDVSSYDTYTVIALFDAVSHALN